MKTLPALLLAAAILLSSCATTPAPKRYAMVTGLNPPKEKYYRELHAHCPPGVVKQIKDCHIRDFSIYRQAIGGKPYLFCYFEYTGKNFDADMKKMADDPETQRWWKQTDPCQVPLPGLPKGKIWTMAEEVYHTP